MKTLNKCPRQHRIAPQTGRQATDIPALRNEANLRHPGEPQSGHRDARETIKTPNKCPPERRVAPPTGGWAADNPVLRNEANFGHRGVALSGHRRLQSHENTE
jgi:hypothetical protein